MKHRHVQLKVRISGEVASKFKQYVSSKYPDFLRGPLSKEVEKALIQYLDSKKENNNNLQNTHSHGEQQVQQQSSNKRTKYQGLIETIKRYSNSQRQISSGLAKKAIQQTIGKDQRTVNKYLKILQEEDIIYGNSLDGMYDIQSWVFGDYNLPSIQQQQENLSRIY